MNACKAVRKGVPLNKGLDDLRKNLGKDLWAHQSSAVKFLYWTLIDQIKGRSCWGALSMFCWAGLAYFMQASEPNMVVALATILFLIQVRGNVEDVWTYLKWRKLPETGKMPTKIAKGDLE